MEREKLVVASRALPRPAAGRRRRGHERRATRRRSAPPVSPAPGPGISLAALDRAKVPVAPRPAGPVVPGLAFPREEESLGVDFVGRVIDSRYRVLRKIGEGGMGTVYAAEHVEIGKIVAIKILHPHYSTEQELVERFRREARAASRIGHPNIIDVMDFGTTDDGCAYFIMEHLDGIDLADVLSHERRLDANRSCEITIQICRALAAAHAAGVIHRDLKPENIFLVARDGKADFVKVLDFGVARSAGRTNRLTNPGIAMGTPEYMAPEQAAGGVVDHRSDIYSVGALLYEMVTGQPPQKRDGEPIGPARAAPAALGGPRSHRRARARPRSGAALSVDGAAGIRPGQDAVGTDAGRRRPARACTRRTRRSNRRRTTSTNHRTCRRCPRRSRWGTRCWNVWTRAGRGRRVESGDARPDAGDAAPVAVADADATPPPETTPLPQQPAPRPVTAPLRTLRTRSASPLLRTPLRTATTSAAPGQDEIVEILPLPDAPAARPGRGGRRFLVTFAVLALAAGVGVRVYGKLPLPWNMRTSVAAPAPTPARRAARARSLRSLAGRSPARRSRPRCRPPHRPRPSRRPSACAPPRPTIDKMLDGRPRFR